jgi:hypothetical protein
MLLCGPETPGSGCACGGSVVWCGQDAGGPGRGHESAAGRCRYLHRCGVAPPSCLKLSLPAPSHDPRGLRVEPPRSASSARSVPQLTAHFCSVTSSRCTSSPLRAPPSRPQRPMRGSCPTAATRNLPLRAICSPLTKPRAGRLPRGLSLGLPPAGGTGGGRSPSGARCLGQVQLPGPGALAQLSGRGRSTTGPASAAGSAAACCHHHSLAAQRPLHGCSPAHAGTSWHSVAPQRQPRPAQRCLAAHRWPCRCCPAPRA